jgi:hypothetical protein
MRGQAASGKSAKIESGDALESLFLIVLLSHCLCGKYACELLPSMGFHRNALVRYSGPYRGDSFNSKDLLEFVEGIPICGGSMLPAVSVYYLGHTKFDVYDMIVAAWDFQGERSLYGYQCKEESSIPTAFANATVFK